MWTTDRVRVLCLKNKSILLIKAKSLQSVTTCTGCMNLSKLVPLAASPFPVPIDSMPWTSFHILKRNFILILFVDVVCSFLLPIFLSDFCSFFFLNVLHFIKIFTLICRELCRVVSSVQFSCSVMSKSLWPHESQHARPPCSSPTPRVHSDSRPLSQWCHPAISSSVVPPDHLADRC